MSVLERGASGIAEPRDIAGLPGRSHPIQSSVIHDAGTTGGRGRSRNGFLDTVRAIALVRVIFWHAFASAPISWLVASMPTMFFVAGSLLAGSIDRKPLRVLMHDRLRRLLVPFWAFGGVVLCAMTLVHQLHPSATTRLNPLSLIAWIVPFSDPHGSLWEAGWVSTPLWYLRCYLWLLLLSPLLRRAQKRFGALALLPSLIGLFAVDAIVRHPGSVPAVVSSLQFYAGDLATYSFFLVLGFMHHDGLVESMDLRARLEWAAIGGIAAVLWLQVAHVPGLVVNNSYPLLLFVGLAWLAIFLTLEPMLSKAPRHMLVGPVVRWLGRRSMSVYLWHPIAIVAGYRVRAMFFPWTPRVAVLPVVALVVVGLCVLFGRIEDLSAGRAAQWWPGRPDPAPPASLRRLRDGLRWLKAVPSPLTLVVGFGVGCLMLGVLVPMAGVTATGSTRKSGTGPSGLALPPPPSKKPTAADFGSRATGKLAAGGASTVGAASTAAGPRKPDSGQTAAAPAVGAVTADDGLRTRVLAAVDAWRQQRGVKGVILGVGLPDGSMLSIGSGTDAEGQPEASDASFPGTSVSKSMTAAIMLQLVAEGKIKLDDPLPDLTSEPGLPFVGKVTIRQLLNHTAGVEPYDTSKGYAAARTGPLTPQTALDLIKNDPLQWTPGSQVGYSNSGYLVLGLLEEQLTGQTYPQLLASRVFAKAGMTDSRLDQTPTAGWSGFSAGGIVTTAADLVRLGAALYRDHKVLDQSSLAQMLNVDNRFSAGLGAFPVCPCGTTTAGKRVYTSIGHNGGQATLEYSPTDKLVIAGFFSESMWTSHLSQQNVAQLLAQVRLAVSR